MIFAAGSLLHVGWGSDKLPSVLCHFRRLVSRWFRHTHTHMLLQEPGHRATHVHQPEPPDRSDHFKLDRVAALRWRLERGYHGVPDQPGPVPPHPLHVDVLCPGYLG